MHDGMGYDTADPQRRRVVPNWLVWVAVASVALMAIWLGFRVTHPSAAPASRTAAPVASVTPPPAPSSLSVTPNPPPADDGTDAVEVGAPAASWRTVGAFLDGWQSTDPEVRRTIFDATATAGLAAGLQDTSPGKVWTGDRTGVQAVAASVTSAEFVVRISGRPPVRLVLVADPSAPNGWRVSALAEDR